MPVVNMKVSKAYDVRIDRQTKWGNPFPMKNQSGNERDRVIEEYRNHLWEEIKDGRKSLEELAALDGKKLGCWCAPKKCHGHVILKAAAWAKKKMEE